MPGAKNAMRVVAEEWAAAVQAAARKAVAEGFLLEADAKALVAAADARLVVPQQCSRNRAKVLQ